MWGASRVGWWTGRNATCLRSNLNGPLRFPLRFDTPWRWVLRLIGVLANIRGYQRTGPYRWWRAIGPRRSLADKGLTFGTSDREGICLCFDDWVESAYVRGGRIESLTVMVEMPMGWRARSRSA